MNEKNYFLFNNAENPDHWRISEIILDQCKKYPKREIIEFINGPKWTFHDLKIKSLEKAQILKELSLNEGNNLTVLIEDPKEFILYWIACSFMGVMFVAINTAIKGNVLLHQIKTSKSKNVLVEDQFFHEVKSLVNLHKLEVEILNCKDLNDKDLLNEDEIILGKLSDNVCTMFTSGTSGPSKGVMMPNAHCVLFAIGTIENYNLRNNHTFYISLPLFHANGLFMQLLACIMTGAKAVIRTRFSASNWLKDIRKYNITHTNMLGAIAAFIVA